MIGFLECRDGKVNDTYSGPVLVLYKFGFAVHFRNDIIGFGWCLGNGYTACNATLVKNKNQQEEPNRLIPREFFHNATAPV
jgi:hypothetical protein